MTITLNRESNKHRPLQGVLVAAGDIQANGHGLGSSAVPLRFLCGWPLFFNRLLQKYNSRKNVLSFD